MKEKECVNCKQSKPHSEFYLMSITLKPREKCKECMRSLANEKTKKKREESENKIIRNLYDPNEFRWFYVQGRVTR